MIERQNIIMQNQHRARVMQIEQQSFATFLQSYETEKAKREEEEDKGADPDMRGICMLDKKNRANVMFTSCCHICLCEECAKEVMEKESKCPRCQVEFKDYIKVYVS